MGTAKKDDGRVELFIPRGTGMEEPNVFISINGKNYLLPRGKKSMVPPEVKYEYERSQEAEAAWAETAAALAENQQA